MNAITQLYEAIEALETAYDSIQPVQSQGTCVQGIVALQLLEKVASLRAEVQQFINAIRIDEKEASTHTPTPTTTKEIAP